MPRTVNVVQRRVERLLKGATFYVPIIFLILIFIILVARVVIAWRSPRQRRVLPAPVSEP